jgi:deazaflavin-dependent oxidoreductase (nitroreductase family)
MGPPVPMHHLHMMSRPDEKNWRQKVVTRTAMSRVGAAISARIMHHLDRLALRLSHGRHTLSTLLTGLETLTLTTTGARSGREYNVPLLAIPHQDDQLIIIASNWGQARNPAWYYNISAQPQVTVTRNGRRQTYLAQETSGSVREACWQVARQTYPGYAVYQQRTSRQIPVILLTPVARCSVISEK